jgi:hypothetical protein
MPTATSEKRKAASRRNGSRGGVKSANGKAAVRWNARKHGILGVLRTDYEGNVYDGYIRRLRDEYDPQGFTEEVLVERIAVCCLMLHRAAKAEREFMLTRLKPPIYGRLSFIDYDEESYKPVMQHEDVERLSSVYLRYQTTIENRLYRAMHELERRQRMRRGETVPSPVPVDVTHDGGFVSQN